MRFAVSPQHRTFFQKNLLITFEELLNPTLIAPFEGDIKPTDKRLLSLIKRTQLAEIAYELTGKKPLRLARVFIGTQMSMNEDECAVFISYKSGATTYVAEELYNGNEACYLILVFTSRYLDASKHPTVYRYD